MDNKPAQKKKVSWWRRRTALEKTLILIVVMVSIAAAVTVAMATASLAGLFSGANKENSISHQMKERSHLATENDEHPSHQQQQHPPHPSLPHPVQSASQSNTGASPNVASGSTKSDHELPLPGNDSMTGDDHLLAMRRKRRRRSEIQTIDGAPGRLRLDGESTERREKRHVPIACRRCRHNRRRHGRSRLQHLAEAQAFRRRSDAKQAADSPRSPDEVCLSADCTKTAARILESVDSAVDPCEDFFEYSCGTWNRVNVIPEDRNSYSMFRKLDDQLQSTLKELLESPLKSSDVDAIKHVKTLYQSCVNNSALDESDAAPLREMMKELGGWPVVEPGWSEDGFDLTTLLAKVKLSSQLVLISYGVGSDDKNSDVNILQMEQGHLGMPSREYYLRGRQDRTLLTYEAFAVAVAKALGAKDDEAKREIAQMIDFEIELANISIPEEKKRDMEAMYHRFHLKNLKDNLTDEIDWLRYFKMAFAPANIEIEGNEEIIIYIPEYIKDLGKLIKKTPKRALANYILWHVVMTRINHMSQKFLDLRRDYNKAVAGTEQSLARWRVCVNHVNDMLGMAVGRMFVEKHFDERAKAMAIVMIKNIRESFKEILQEVPWMDESTKKFAQEKAQEIDEKIGFPDYILNDTALNLDYEGIMLHPERYFDNALNISRVSVINNHKQIRLPADRERWAATPAVVNAFYNAQKNAILFPAGIFRPPFYHENYPMSLNFGGIGMVIGHEITHGFDDKGRQYDRSGNLKQWWTDNDIKHFKERAQCIIDQYSNYTVKEVGLNVNGRLTQGENIADNGGLKQAYRAYKKWANSHPPEPTLPGLNLTHDQLFFLNFAQVWCGTARPENHIQNLRAGKHCPGMIRVIGSVSNSPEFAKAFNCHLGSSMNPVKKCSVW